MRFSTNGVAGVMAELPNIVQEKYRGRGASSRGFVARLGEKKLCDATHDTCFQETIAAVELILEHDVL